MMTRIHRGTVIVSLTHSRHPPRAAMQMNALSSPRCPFSWTARRRRAAATPAVAGKKATIFNTVPIELLSSTNEQHQDGQESSSAKSLTVYSVRFTTGYARGAALSEPYSGVHLLLVGKDSQALLQRVSPLNDPTSSIDQVNTICQIVDETVGANCSILAPCTPLVPPSSSASPVTPAPLSSSSPQGSSRGSPAAASLSSKPALPKLRFQEGQVDEVCFLAPDLGPLAGVLVGTEAGSWMLDEVVVSSSRTAHTDRFVCREKLGVKAGEGATWLVPVPPNASVYGSGENTVILTKEQASSLREMYMAEYDDLKSRLLVSNAVLTLGGTGVAGLAAGLDAALPFAVGGAAGLAYQWMLQLGVDGMLSKMQPAPAPAAAAAPGVASEPLAGSSSGEQRSAVQAAPPVPLAAVAANPALRLGFVAAVCLFGVSSLHNQGLVQQAVASCEGLQCMVGHSTKEGVWKLFFGLLGFLTYKIALVGSSLSHQGDEAGGKAAATSTQQLTESSSITREDSR